MVEEDTVVNKAERFEGSRDKKGEEDPLLGPTALPFGPAPVPPRLATTEECSVGDRVHTYRSQTALAPGPYFTHFHLPGRLSIH